MALTSSMLPKKFSSKMMFAGIALVTILAITVPSYYFYLQYQKTQKMLESPTDAAKEEIALTVEQVGKLILLPSDEEPTLATVSDKTKVQNQALIQANVANGDKILIYSRSKKAYLYRPSINKIIDVAPVSIGSAAPTPQPVNITASGSPSPSAKPTVKISPTSTPGQVSTFQKVNVALYNGTRTAGLAAKTETNLKTKAPYVSVVAKGNAANTYTETLVVDFTGKYKKEAAELVKILGGSTGVLPKGELKPTADILVILGPQ